MLFKILQVLLLGYRHMVLFSGLLSEKKIFNNGTMFAEFSVRFLVLSEYLLCYSSCQVLCNLTAFQAP